MSGLVTASYIGASDDLSGGEGLLTTWDWELRYNYVFYLRPLAQEPAVAARLAELRIEASEGAKQIGAYIAEHGLQL